MSTIATAVPWQPCEKAGWPAVQVKHMFQTALGKMLQPQPASDDDIEAPYIKSLHVQWHGVSFEDLPTMWASPIDIEQLELRVGDLMVCEGGEVGRGALVLSDPPPLCIFQNALHRVRAHGLNDVRYLNYCLKQASEAGWFDVLCNRATIAHFTVEKFRELRIHLPSSETQRLIANYLDRETARIDALIAEKERMLALLEEKRAALISRVVTRGLDPNAPLKPSGQEWLGEIPAHWEVKRCATVFTEIDERNEPVLPLLNVSLNTGVTLRVFSDERIESVAADFTTYKVARRGDLVFNKMRFWQGAGGIAPIDGLTSPDYTVARLDNALCPEYIELLVRLPLFSNEVRRYSYGMVDDRLRLYWDAFRNLRIPVPPVSEQEQIAQAATNSVREIQELCATLKCSISLTKERRAALITAAVTGQIPPEAMRG